jgi:hypothetical protein
MEIKLNLWLSVLFDHFNFLSMIMKHINKLSLIIFSIITLFESSNALSQAPEKMSYQSVLRGTNNALVTNQNVRVKISILQGTITDSAAYVEEHTTSTNNNGLVSLSIGGGTLISGNFSTINWANGPYFVKMEADPTGGTNYTISGTTQLLSVPYALYAKSAGSVSGGGGSTGGGGFTHYIGEQFGGGIIFYLWKDAQGNEHGLIVSNTELGFSNWSNVSQSIIGPSAQRSFDGFTNTNAIVSQPGHLYSAAQICLDSESGGFTDWYLPSVDELSLLWQNRFIVNKSLSTVSGSALLTIPIAYWTSTELIYTETPMLGQDLHAWLFDFQNGGSFYSEKNSNGYVRAIRSF